MSKNDARCPECGYPDIYLGAWAVECGYDPECPNWTATQAEEVDRLFDVRYSEPDYSEDSQESKSDPHQFSLDYGDDDVTPTWPVPDFSLD